MSPPNNEPTMKPPESGVKVRMYNPGFGDCLLLAFRADDGKGRYMLIDFGMHTIYPNQSKKSKLIAKDIAAATGNHLHVVAVTHEHSDHLYGFRYSKQELEDVEIDELWLSWAENPADSVAKKLKQEHGKKMRGLEAAIKLVGRVDPGFATRLSAVHGFEFENALSATSQNEAQLQYLRDKSKKKLESSGDYLRPGKILSLPDVSGVKVYVIGPPRDEEAIEAKDEESEIYPELAAVSEMGAFAAAALETAGGELPDGMDAETLKRSHPFAESFEISKEGVLKDRRLKNFFTVRYGFSEKDEKGHGPKWRRIDYDWLAAAEGLSLALNDMTNNTSLVLAFELADTEPRKVLLFAGDAQVGNWLSWHELHWPDEEDELNEISMENILNRTVLYKVGHHGSRNATLKDKGLEMMESGDLMAMIPVDEEWAHETYGWEHPAPKLLGKLFEKCRGRVIRSDDIPPGEEAPERPEEATEAQWSEFLNNLDWDRGEDRLWIQYTVTA